MKTKMPFLLIMMFLFAALPLPAVPRQTVSVFYFQNTAKSSSHAWLSKGLADMLITDLSQIPSITVVEREQLQRVIKEHSLGMTGMTDKSTVLKTGKLFSAKKIITGSFIERGGSLRIDCRVIDAETGKVSSVKTSGRSADILRLQKNLLHQVQGIFGVARKVKPLRETKSRDAMRHYYRGIDYLDRGKYREAEKNFKQSIEYDPLYSLPQRDLEKAYRFLMNLQRARIQRELSILFDAVRIVRGRLNGASAVWLKREMDMLKKKSEKRSGFISWFFLRNRVGCSAEVACIDNLKGLLDKVNGKLIELEHASDTSSVTSPDFRKEEKRIYEIYRKKMSANNALLRKYRRSRHRDPEEGRRISRERTEIRLWYRDEKKKLRSARKNYSDQRSMTTKKSADRIKKRREKFTAEVLFYWNRAWRKYSDSKNRESLVATRLNLHFNNSHWKETAEWSKYYLLKFPDGRRGRVAEIYYKTALDRMKMNQ